MCFNIWWFFLHDLKGKKAQINQIFLSVASSWPGNINPYFKIKSQKQFYDANILKTYSPFHRHGNSHFSLIIKLTHQGTQAWNYCLQTKCGLVWGAGARIRRDCGCTLAFPFPYHRNKVVASPFRVDLTAAHTKGNSSSGRIVIDPEGHPREDGDQDGGHIRLKNEVTNVSLQPKTQRKSRVGTYSKHKGTVRSHSRRSAPASRGQWLYLNTPGTWKPPRYHAVCSDIYKRGEKECLSVWR